MDILSSDEMKDIENKTIKNYIPGLLLMEKAALNIVHEIRKRFDNREKLKILYVCGPGNNGGDGFATARMLAGDFKESDILFLGSEENLAEDAFLNYNIAKKMEINFINEIEKDYDIIVDAIFGIGLNKDLDFRLSRIVGGINKNRAYKIAVDIASGINANTGEIMGKAVKADLTVTFHRAKIAHFIYPGRDYTGELVISDIGIVKTVSENFKSEIEAIGTEDIDIKKMEKTIHKGQAGKILVIAGNKKYTGAAYLASEAALRSGAGLVSLAVPESINRIMALKTVEVMNVALGETDGNLAEKAYFEIKEHINESKPELIIIGPGLGREKATIDFVKKIISEFAMKFVIDADALYAIKDDLEILKGKEAILTPHLGEFKRLYPKQSGNRLEDAIKFAKENEIVLILKGADSIVTDGKKTYINTSGNVGMAVGGMGDILSGIVGAFFLREKDSLKASKNAVYLHGLCGDRVLEEYGELSLTPTKILDGLEKVLKEFC